MKYIPILLAMALGCSDQGHVIVKQVCSPESVAQRSKFIIDCATAANPKSDEEGEDLVIQCERTAKNLFCTEAKAAYITGVVDDYTEILCSEATDPVRKRACGL